MSLILRHRPEAIGITLDRHGWADVEQVLKGVKISMAELEEIVASDEKQRYRFSEDKTRIRANQGHSIPVDLELEEREPPEFLYHGTIGAFLDSIRKQGLQRQSRQYVHLSKDVETAGKTGGSASGRGENVCGRPSVLPLRKRRLADRRGSARLYKNAGSHIAALHGFLQDAEGSMNETRSSFMELKFDERGLIPAIVQDHYTKEVLTLAYMNAESLAITIDERRTCFWSRSRQELWRKGETSGSRQHVVSIAADCDADALVVEVVKDGPACHTGAESCFFNEIYLSDELKKFSYEGLYQLIAGRKTSPKEGSYTTYLFDKGLDKILKKVGEECTEVIIAGRKEDKAETVYEIADLCYHVMVLMVQMGISVEDVTRELETRHVVDHKVKQERMQ